MRGRNSSRLAAGLIAALIVILSPRHARSEAVDQDRSSNQSHTGMAFSSFAPGGRRFVGSRTCAGCHPKQYAGWKKTYHSSMIQDTVSNPSAILGDLASKNFVPYTREDIEYAVGSHWNQRYLKKIGDEYFVIPRIWSIQSRGWSREGDYSWKKLPYSKNCAGCHNVFFDPGKRTVAEPNIGCEACHGPGGEHAAGGAVDLVVHPSRLSTERSDMICASCHVRGTDPSGEYRFPVGYLPGDDLSRFLIPLEMNEGTGETAYQALLRKIEEMRRKMEKGILGQCVT